MLANSYDQGVFQFFVFSNGSLFSIFWTFSDRLCPEAKAVLREFYLDLRKSSRTVDSTPITTRQLESTIRLTEARARLELREVATEQDAKVSHTF